MPQKRSTARRAASGQSRPSPRSTLLLDVRLAAQLLDDLLQAAQGVSWAARDGERARAAHGEGLGMDAALNHGDADGQGAAVQVAVLSGDFGSASAGRPAGARAGARAQDGTQDGTHQEDGDFVKDVDGLLRGGVLVGVGHGAGGRDAPRVRGGGGFALGAQGKGGGGLGGGFWVLGAEWSGWIATPAGETRKARPCNNQTYSSGLSSHRCEEMKNHFFIHVAAMPRLSVEPPG